MVNGLRYCFVDSSQPAIFSQASVKHVPAFIYLSVVVINCILTETYPNWT